jgi:hypothetical protein
MKRSIDVSNQIQPPGMNVSSHPDTRATLSQKVDKDVHEYLVGLCARVIGVRIIASERLLREGFLFGCG